MFLSAGVVIPKYKYIPTKTDIAKRKAELFPTTTLKGGLPIKPIIIGLSAVVVGYFVFKKFKKKKVSATPLAV